VSKSATVREVTNLRVVFLMEGSTTNVQMVTIPPTIDNIQLVVDTPNKDGKSGTNG